MRKSAVWIGLGLACLICVGVIPSARAQTQTQPACSGSLGLGLSMTVAIRTPAGFNPIQTTALNNILSRAECECDVTDLFVQIQVTQAISRTGTQPSLEVWVGNGCDQATNRQSTSTACERIADSGGLTSALFYPGGATGFLYLQIPVRALVSPTSRQCSGSPANSIWFLFGAQSTTPDGVCRLTLQSQNTLPDPPSEVAARSGDGAINLQWTAPPSGPQRPRRYQVLCADEDNNPGLTPTSDFLQAYSTCLPSGIQRRTDLPTNGVINGAVDAGTADASTADLATADLTPGPDLTSADLTSAPDLTGADLGGTGDGGTADAGTGVPGFDTLDPRFLCSEPIENTSIRITGLTNNRTYKFLVIGVDDFGNAAPAASVVTGAPQPVQDLYDRFRDLGGRKQGFCFIATAAYGSYDSPLVLVLRRFRDEALAQSTGGQAFIDWYYAHSPGAADYIAARPSLRAVVRVLLLPVVALAWVWLAVGPAGLVLLAAAWALWTVGRAQRRARAA